MSSELPAEHGSRALGAATQPQVGDFAGSFADLHLAVVEACARHEEWPDCAAEAIHAAVAFAAANPLAARALIVDADLPEPVSACQQSYLIEHFAAMLEARAPAPLTATTEEALVSHIVTTIAGHLRSGRLDRLEEASTDLVFVTLLPYFGFDEAKRWSETERRGG